MKVESYKYPHSSFLAIEKDLDLITSQMLKNERLKKLIYYQCPDALEKPNLTQEQSFSLLGNQIKIVPKIKVDQPEWCYIYIKNDDFLQSPSNPQFRENYLVFIIVCHFDDWVLKNSQIRPYRIAAEIDSMFNRKRLSGIGLTQFISADETVMTDEFGALSLAYQVMHGYEGEDSKNALNPREQEDLINQFNQMYNTPNEL